MMEECKGVAAARKSKDVVMAAGPNLHRWWQWLGGGGFLHAHLPPLIYSHPTTIEECIGKQADFSSSLVASCNHLALLDRFQWQHD
jgi:hypothetical protein